MNETLVSLACHAYGFAALVYLTYLARSWTALAVVGRMCSAIELTIAN